MTHCLDAFGLSLAVDWPLPGTVPASSAPPGRLPLTSVRLVPTAEIDAQWARPAEVLSARNLNRDEVTFTIERTDAVYRLWCHGYGRFVVSLDGATVLCEDGAAELHVQERFLNGQILPLAAVLQGRELLHASAVDLEGGVVALSGPPGVGKTTTMSRLVIGGAGFVSDDVIALEQREGALVAHAGPPFAAIDDEDVARRLGTVLGFSDKLNVAVANAGGEHPLRAIYYLERGSLLEIAPVEHGHIHKVLESAFISYLSTPERLMRQLDVAHLVARAIPQFRLVIPDGANKQAVNRLKEHVNEMAAAC